MKEFKVINGNERITFNFPVSLKEITDDYLDAIANKVNVAAHHSLIGLVCRESLFNVVTTLKQKKNNITTGVIPIFISHGETDSKFIESLKLKDRLVIPTNMLALAYHVNVNDNVLSMDYFMRYAKEDTSIGIRVAAQKEKVCFLDLKLIANSSIVGAYRNANLSNEITNNYVSFEGESEE